jgi:hypothetical protein
MKKTSKQQYEIPTLQVVEVKSEGFLCASNRQARVSNYNWYTEDEE